MNSAETPVSTFGRRELGFAERLVRSIHAGGPISLANYMAQVNAHYYGTRNPLGTDGDFITAPEISQMFGELIGLCLADLWQRAGQANAPYYVELGPGRGTLAADALRAMAQARLAPQAHLVETSPALRAHQSTAVAHAHFHDDVETLPTDRPLLVVANEFFDALPIAQAVKAEDGWREVMVGLGGEGATLAPLTGERRVDARVPEAVRHAPLGAVHESCPVGATIMLTLARRIARQGGAMILIDYGYEGPALGDTLQAVRAHRYADPFKDIGDNDLTAHVDFTLLGNAARQEGLVVHGPVGQGAFLERLGIGPRAQTLARAQPERVTELETARQRLAGEKEMGRLFKVLGVTHPDWPWPEGFR
ncbi:MAG: SAM-dependent methyltransferase [Sphingobium sp.]|jgi:NADH dehydrogenase [ubiquinone] 1 alpha subcomplex assembly factor 7|nr:SAM-dependent methyltransferase [Sphingobium sp.]MCI1271421.1 SAM-dependent methyltransferase [Sphingobium sp.]MCI1755638.1 SAM-dependent methyltransferase [Sphingobium sp.]MCI2052534.1 SAM-dependent methyltransferase [Sphingobium sp.]